MDSFENPKERQELLAGCYTGLQSEPALARDLGEAADAVDFEHDALQS